MSNNTKEIMLSRELESICQYYLKEFKRARKTVSLSRLESIARKEAEKARRNYLTLSRPKTCDTSTYINLWVRESLENKFYLETLSKVNLKKQNSNNSNIFIKRLSEFYKILPFELIKPLQVKIFQAPLSERHKVWEDLHIQTVDIERKMQKLLIARKRELSKINQLPFIDIFLKKYKIPKRDYKEFNENIDNLIKDINSRLPKTQNQTKDFYSEFNLPCFICQLTFFPFNSQKEVVNFVAKEYPVIKRFNKKVKIIKDKEKTTSTIYRKETDTIEITMGNEVNIRHQSVVLIHELGHAISIITNLAKGDDLIFSKGKYGAEKEAIKIELDILKKASKQLYQAFLGEVLITFCKVLFEIELNRKPRQNISKLYAKSFNRCFLGARQKENYLYILEEDLITSPFRKLPHAVALYKLLYKTKD